MKAGGQHGPGWTTRRKVVVGISIAAGLFAAANFVVLGLFDRHSDWQFDLATLRLEQVWTTEFLRWRVWQQVEEHNTPASAALAKAGLTTGLSGKAGGGTTYWRTPTWWGGNEYLGMGGPSAFHPILFDNGVVLLLQRKGASGLPTLRKILDRFRTTNPDDSQTTGQMLYRTLREDYPAENWPDPWYGTNQPTTGMGTGSRNREPGTRNLEPRRHPTSHTGDGESRHRAERAKKQAIVRDSTRPRAFLSPRPPSPSDPPQENARC